MKIFYVGMQRCGTKSFGDFFRKNGFKICSWNEIVKYNLSELFHKGLWLDILQSGIFDEYDVFEDGPFFDPVFAKFLSHYIDNSHFVYFHRPTEDWYKSMVTHSNGLTIGDLNRHCYIYDRLEEVHFLQSELSQKVEKLSLIGMKTHYEKIYTRHFHQILEKFSTVEPSRFYSDELYNKDKFRNMSEHFQLKISDHSEQRSHTTRVTIEDVVSQHEYLF